jgi:nickel/cobalt exporter
LPCRPGRASWRRAAHAQSSLGIGSNEVAVQPAGVCSRFLPWINEMQRGFYREMTDAL